MKKLLTGIAVIALVVSIGSTSALAAGRGCGRNFVDSDGNGVCDNYDSNGCGNGAGFVDADGDGVCDNYGSNGCGNGAGYVDADGDGVCDNFATGTTQNGCGIRRGHCGGQGIRCR